MYCRYNIRLHIARIENHDFNSKQAPIIYAFDTMLYFVEFTPVYLFILSRHSRGEISKQILHKLKAKYTSFPIKREQPDRVPEEGNVFTLHEIINLCTFRFHLEIERLLTRVCIIEKRIHSLTFYRHFYYMPTVKIADHGNAFRSKYSFLGTLYTLVHSQTQDPSLQRHCGMKISK